MKNRIEILRPDLLNENHDLIQQLKQMNYELAMSSGWHYFLDWAWVIKNIDNIDNKIILDAGAGIGLLQWYLANKGANVISVDRSDRTCCPHNLVRRFNVSGLRPEDTPLGLSDIANLFRPIGHKTSKRIKVLVRGFIGNLRTMGKSIPRSKGSVKLYNTDLVNLSEISEESVDVIVSISALEHNSTISKIRDIIRELGRVLKPGGTMLITLPASRDRDWFLDSAYAWCLTDETIRNIFELSSETPSNYGEFNAILNEIKGSTTLRRNVSSSYYLSPKSGMPWGKWDPKYLPVGIIKTKQV
jgi:2-polyprenyl-3-methyl-5-hydroxy-6-metoxy-1,4-benzoquinol methylase